MIVVFAILSVLHLYPQIDYPGRHKIKSDYSGNPIIY